MLKSELELNYYHQWLQQNEWNNDFSAVPEYIREWLEDMGSLTAKLKESYPSLNVELLKQEWINATEIVGTSIALDDHSDYLSWLREVILKNNEQPLIFAQTFIPQQTVKFIAKPLLTIGERPIGEWLFTQPLVRKNLEWKQEPLNGYYARRSILELSGYPLEIREMFYTFNM